MSADRARILVVTYTEFAQEPRALKQVAFLRESHDVTTAGFGSAPFPDVPHIEIPAVPAQKWGLAGKLLGAGLLALHWYRAFLGINALDRAARRLLGGTEWDIVIAHDLKTLEASLELAPRHGVVLDLHEYAPRQEEHSRLWRLLVAPYFRWLCRTRAPRAASVVTVGEGIAEEYRREFGLDATVVVNATPYHEFSPGRVGSPLRLVHSGMLTPHRRLDLLIRGVRESTADATLDLYLVGDDPTLRRELVSLADGDTRIRFRDPVPYDRLMETLNAYDVGVHLLPALNFNHRWALPNKFFDFVQARLGVIVGPSPEMARVVEEYGIGLVLPDFEPASLAAALDSLTVERVVAWKAASAANALALSSDAQGLIWERLIAGLLPGRTVNDA